MKYCLNCDLFFILLLGSLPSLTLNVYLSLPWDKSKKQKEIATIKHRESQGKNSPDFWRSHPQPPAKLSTKADHVAQTVHLSLEDR